MLRDTQHDMRFTAQSSLEVNHIVLPAKATAQRTSAGHLSLALPDDINKTSSWFPAPIRFLGPSRRCKLQNGHNQVNFHHKHQTDRQSSKPEHQAEFPIGGATERSHLLADRGVWSNPYG